jgi:hypothetical protein
MSLDYIWQLWRGDELPVPGASGRYGLLVVDLSMMKSVRVDDPASRTVRVYTSGH